MDVKYTAHDKKIGAAFGHVLVEATKNIESYRLDLAADNLYHYVWHEFADVVIEDSKTIFKNGSEKEKSSRKKLLFLIFKESIIALHPFMPFITEEIWEIFRETKLIPKESSLLAIEPW